MGKPVAGDVVVLPFPQTNLQPGKRRPALVVADLAGDDLILCQITIQIRPISTPMLYRSPPPISRAAILRRIATREPTASSRSNSP